MELLQSVLQVNDKVRKDRDWEKMRGRAVVDEFIENKA